ncbi:MAG: hypothetical protein AB7V45_14915 [Candidatus Krumholzibacteriia bacterium]
MYRKLEDQETLDAALTVPEEGEDPCVCACLQAVERGSEAPVPKDLATEQLRVYYDINGLLPNNTR